MIYLRRTVKITAFLLGLVILLLATSFIFEPKNNSKEAGMENPSTNGFLGEKSNTLDVLILGNSVAYSSFSPMEIWNKTGYTSYVCSSPSQLLDYSLTLLQRAFDTQKPKIVFLETDNIHSSVPHLNALGTVFKNDFPIFEYHDRWKALSTEDLYKTPDHTWIDFKKGYLYDPSVKGRKEPLYNFKTKKVKSIPPVNADLIREIHTLCAKNDAKLVFISAPNSKNWNYKKHNAIQALAEKMQCEYMDLNLQNDELQIDWARDTRDHGEHLNHYGALKVTNYLADYLVQSNLFIDHRDDSEFQNWDDSLKKYLELVNKK